MAAINGGDARGNGFGFEGMIDGRENNGVVGHVNDGAATGEVGNDFVFLGTDGGAGPECGQQDQRGLDDKVLHGGRVAHRAENRPEGGRSGSRTERDSLKYKIEDYGTR